MYQSNIKKELEAKRQEKREQKMVMWFGFASFLYFLAHFLLWLF